MRWCGRHWRLHHNASLSLLGRQGLVHIYHSHCAKEGSHICTSSWLGDLWWISYYIIWWIAWVDGLPCVMLGAFAYSVYSYVHFPLEVGIVLRYSPTQCGLVYNVSSLFIMWNLCKFGSLCNCVSRGPLWVSPLASWATYNKGKSSKRKTDEKKYTSTIGHW